MEPPPHSPDPQPNYSEYPGQGFDPNRARAKVNAPALLLIVLSLAGMAWGLFNVASTVLQLAGVLPVDPQIYARLGIPVPSPQEQLVHGMIGLGFAFMQLLTGSLIIFGAVQMRRLRSYGFAQVGAILALIPCIGPCCGCLTPPFAIWALVVLFNAEVKYAFALNAEGRLPESGPVY